MTTPSKLKPGDLVKRKGDAGAPVLTFVARHGGKYCRCQCDKYKGLDGPNDAGFVDVSDWDMARKYERVYEASGVGRLPKPWRNADLAFAFESAADFLEMEEWPEDDGGAQVRAYKEAAKRIRRMVARVPPDEAI